MSNNNNNDIGGEFASTLTGKQVWPPPVFRIQVTGSDCGDNEEEKEAEHVEIQKSV